MNLDRAMMPVVHAHVIAAGIAAGRPGPFEYYLYLADGDERLATELQGRAHLAQLMRGVR